MSLCVGIQLQEKNISVVALIARYNIQNIYVAMTCQCSLNHIARCELCL